MVAFYVYIPAIILGLWQLTERSRMEKHAKLRQRLKQVPQCIPRSMVMFAGITTGAFLFRAVWFFGRGTKVLSTQGGGSCRAGTQCWEQLLSSLCNRISQTLFFAAFAIIGEIDLGRARPLHAEPNARRFLRPLRPRAGPPHRAIPRPRAQLRS